MDSADGTRRGGIRGSEGLVWADAATVDATGTRIHPGVAHPGRISQANAEGAKPGPAASDAGCDTDYLAEHGGETSIQPTEGMTHTRPDGSTASWFRYLSDENIIDLKKILGGRPTDHAIAYAFTTVHREKAGPATLGVGSDDGVMIWVNGQLVHRHIVGRAVKLDDDRVAVDFKQGENDIPPQD